MRGSCSLVPVREYYPTSQDSNAISTLQTVTDVWLGIYSFEPQFSVIYLCMKCKQNLNNYQQKLTELTVRQPAQTKQEMRYEPKRRHRLCALRIDRTTGSDSWAVRRHLCGNIIIFAICKMLLSPYSYDEKWAGSDNKAAPVTCSSMTEAAGLCFDH